MNGSFLIPCSFKLGNKTIKVIVDDDYCDSEGCWGEADFSEKIITLCSGFKKKKLNKVIREKTFYHELVHQILSSIGHHKLKFNEDFVDAFAERLYEFEKTKQ